MEMVNTRKVIIWGHDDLLVNVVDLFLGESKAFDVVKVSSFGSEKHLLQEMQRVNPDVVILCKEKIEDNPTLPLELIRDSRDLKVISVDMVGNFVQVYCKYNFVLQRVSDLLSVVEGRWFAENELERVMVSES